MSFQIGFPFSSLQNMKKKEIQQACIYNYSIINHSMFYHLLKPSVKKNKIIFSITDLF